MKKDLNWKIVNIVASANIGKLDNIEKLLDKLQVEYEPRRFPAIFYRPGDQEHTILIFTSGKLVCAGYKSKSDVKRAIKKVAKEIKSVCKTTNENPAINICNIVASYNFKREIDLESAYNIFQKYFRDVFYEPEQFPALMFHIAEGANTSILLYRSGRAICAGLRKERDIYSIFHKIEKILDENKQFL